MDVLNQWQDAQAHLKSAISSYLTASNTLQTAITRPTEYTKGDWFERIVDTIQLNLDSLDQMHLEMDQSRVTINRLLNASTSRVAINKLPPETLARIFSFATSLSPCRPAPKQRDSLVDILRVCTRWHQTAIGDPSLWTHVDIHMEKFDTVPHYPGIQRALVWLGRAQGMPIHIHFCHHEEYVGNDAVTLAVSILKPHAPAFDSLIFSGEHSQRVLQAMFSLCLTDSTSGSIRTLSVSEIWPHSSKDIISWPTQSLRGLVNLSLSNLPNAVSPSMDGVFSMLSNSPCLHTLRLRHMNIRSGQGQNFQVVKLPCLRLLDITGLYEATISILLPMLFPGTLELDLRLDLCDDEDVAPVVESFLKRSNVVHFTVGAICEEHADQLNMCLSTMPNLRVLIADMSGDENRYILDAMAPPSENQLACRFPDLYSFGLISASINQEEIDHLKRVVAAHSLCKIAFASCAFPREDSDQDEGDEEDEDSGKAVPEELMKWLSDRVGSVVVEEELDIEADDDLDMFITKLSRAG